MKIKRIDISEFEFFYDLLEEDFPWEERKTREDELRSFSNLEFNPCFIIKKNQLVGYFCYWDFADFIFGEHFAIVKDFRNNGLGTQFLKQFLNSLEKQLIIEVERPDTDIAKRRINFYKRLGFVVNDFDYAQPSYHQDGIEVPMLLLSYKEKITKEEYNRYTTIVRKVVYNLKK